MSESKKDNLHIPHIGAHHWIPQSQKENIKASEEDTKKRPISIRFFLEDTRARTPYVFGKLPKTKDFHANYDNDNIDFRFEENSNLGLLQSIFVGLHTESAKKAFDTASTHLLSMLSIMSYRYRRPFCIRSVCIVDDNHQAKWLIHPTCQNPIEIELPQWGFIQSEPIGTMFALFREGMNSNSDSYRFLCFFKIIESWKKRKCAFKSTDDKYKKIYASVSKRNTLKVTKTLLSGAYCHKYHDNFIERKFKDIFEELSEIRDMIAHPFKDKKSAEKVEYFFNLDAPEYQAYIGAFSNLVERMATKILDEELQILASIDSNLKKML